MPSNRPPHATLNCSESPQKVGTLEPGKLADVIAMPSDPTADITATERVFFVMKEGKILKQGHHESTKADHVP
jgi:imidazolonepropionase-like amidohydrolase